MMCISSTCNVSGNCSHPVCNGLRSLQPVDMFLIPLMSNPFYVDLVTHVHLWVINFEYTWLSVVIPSIMAALFSWPRIDAAI